MKKVQPILILSITGLFILSMVAVFFINTKMYEIPSLSAYQNQAKSNGITAQRININLASGEELELLPGIGPALAERIIAYRREHGGFQDTAELLNVSGIGPKTLAKIENYITVGGSE